MSLPNGMPGQGCPYPTAGSHEGRPTERMFYYILYDLIFNHFKDQDWYLVKALNVFQYVTFRTAYASVTAMLISLLFGRKLINALKRWNIGQQIREEGPQAHADDGMVVDEEDADARRGVVQGNVSGKLGDRRIGRGGRESHGESTP